MANHHHPHADDDDNDEEDPKDSVAANCIRFFHSLSAGAEDRCFAPVFTHQCFPGEFIPGYHPLETGGASRSTKITAHNQQQQHSSFAHAATHSLAIAIELTPGCDACTVSVDCRPLKRALEESTTDDDKKQTEDPEDPAPAAETKNSSTNQATKNSQLNINNDDGDSVELGSEDSDSEDEEDNAIQKETPPPKRLSEQEICAQLQKFLPPIIVPKASPSKDASSFQYLKTPFGTIITEYSHGDDMDFSLTVCSGKECADYHSAVQKLAPWYIESASDIDPTEDEGKAWKILYLFRKHNKNAPADSIDHPCYYYSLAGYMTLYHFESPFRKPLGGTIVRVCQALILPMYHRMGHGKRMLHAVFGICSHADNNNNIVEVNVEDPAPAFSSLRDVVDWERYQQTGRQWFVDDKRFACCHDIAKAEFFAALKESDALEITTVALTTARQIQTVHELDRLHRLQEYLQQASGKDSAANRIDDEQRELLEKRFRLMVKQRLNRQNREGSQETAQ